MTTAHLHRDGMSFAGVCVSGQDRHTVQGMADTQMSPVSGRIAAYNARLRTSSFGAICRTRS